MCRESLNEVFEKYGRCKNAVKGRSLRVNVNKANVMQLLFRMKSSFLNVDSFDVCSEWVGCNSNQVTKFQRWVHRCCCSDLPRQGSLLSCKDVEHVQVIILH